MVFKSSKTPKKAKKMSQAAALQAAREMEKDPAEVIETPEEVVTLDDRAIGSLASIGGVSTDDLKLQLQAETDQRAVIKQFVQHHLQNDIDYGRIHVLSKDKCPDQYTCKKDWHYSKAILFKPGMEKLFSLFKITTRLERDDETYQMLPDIKNLVAYKCVMLRGEQLIGEGRGSAAVGDSRRDVNATIKIAQKRARMDACLSLGFSEYFAQDLDDPEYQSAAQMTNQKVAAAAEERDKDELGLMPRDEKLPMDDTERTMLFKWMQLRGHDVPQMKLILAENGYKDSLNMTSGDARKMLKSLKDNLYAIPKTPDAADPDLPIIDVNADLNIPSQPVTTQPEVIVDDEMRNYVAARALEIGLNQFGTVWLMKTITGKQWSKWENFTDKDWKRAYEVVEGILDTTIELDPAHMKSEANGKRKMDFTEPLNQEDKDQNAVALETLGGEEHPIDDVPDDLK